jgi:hypothetical protein
MGKVVSVTPGAASRRRASRRGRKKGFAQVGEEQGEVPPVLRRVELRARLQRAAQHGQGLAQRRGQALGMRRGLHAAAGAHEQRIAGQAAQPAQRVAHRGLGQAQALGGARDLALGIHRLEHQQQAQVGAGGCRIILQRNKSICRHSLQGLFADPTVQPHKHKRRH